MQLCCPCKPNLCTIQAFLLPLQIPISHTPCCWHHKVHHELWGGFRRGRLRWRGGHWCYHSAQGRAVKQGPQKEPLGSKVSGEWGIRPSCKRRRERGQPSCSRHQPLLLLLLLKETAPLTSQPVGNSSTRWLKHPGVAPPSFVSPAMCPDIGSCRL